jgi:hypothetical protein
MSNVVPFPIERQRRLQIWSWRPADLISGMRFSVVLIEPDGKWDALTGHLKRHKDAQAEMLSLSVQHLIPCVGEVQMGGVWSTEPLVEEESGDAHPGS